MIMTNSSLFFGDDHDQFFFFIFRDDHDQFFFFIFRDDHQFSPLHWAAKGGHLKILEMLIGQFFKLIIKILEKYE